MGERRVTTRAIKERCVWAAQELMLRAGVQVTEIRDGDRITLDIYLPPDSQDPHGERLLAATT